MIAEAQELLSSASEAGIQIFVEGGRIRQVYGQWWVQDLIDSIWEREIEIVALLGAAPSIFRLVRHVVDQLPTFLN